MTSPAWLADYTAALQARDVHEKAHEAQTNAYTTLADRTARLEAERLTAPLPPAAVIPVSPALPLKSWSPGPSRFGRSNSVEPHTPTSAPPADALARLRVDLAATQTSRASLEVQLAAKNAELAVEKTQAARVPLLERRLRDRESEIKGKSRLAEKVQDELISVNLQLNMAEQRSEELERENRDLVDRWMKYKREEADRMNTQSNWR